MLKIMNINASTLLSSKNLWGLTLRIVTKHIILGFFFMLLKPGVISSVVTILIKNSSKFAELSKPPQPMLYPNADIFWSNMNLDNSLAVEGENITPRRSKSCYSISAWLERGRWTSSRQSFGWTGRMLKSEGWEGGEGGNAVWSLGRERGRP